MNGLDGPFAAALGMALGSFVNVLIYRLPLRRSVVFPRSRCPACGTAIKPYDNVPVLSYLVLLRGRCRSCRAGISFRYPAVELMVGFGSLVAYGRHGWNLEYLAEVVFLGSMLALVVIDYRQRVLPDAITLTGAVVGLAISGPRASLTFYDALAGAALGFGILYLVAEIYFRLRRVQGLGMGDVKMLMMVGAFLGWKGVLLTLLVGSMLGSVFGLGLVLLRGRTLRAALPFGTFLGPAAVVSLFAGRSLADWYIGLM
jgi:leader peptidase (prepilin peptidase)/N-methyltransferase